MNKGYPWKERPNIKNSLASFIADYTKKTGIKSRKSLFKQRLKISNEFMAFAKKHHCFEVSDPRFTKSCVSMQVAWALTPQKDSQLIKSHPSGAFIKREYKILMQLQGVN